MCCFVFELLCFDQQTNKDTYFIELQMCKMETTTKLVEEDDSWVLIDIGKTATKHDVRQLFRCIIPSYLSFDAYNRRNNPRCITFQPKLTTTGVDIAHP